MLRNITFTLNGRETHLAVDVRTSLLEMLRNQLGLLSVKEGCGVGECGACTVLVDDQPVDACIYLALWVEGKMVRSLEGEVKAHKVSAVQQAYIDEGAVQCGFCTPGFIMTSTALVEKNCGEHITSKDIRREHAGNLCRCTGYENIIRAVESCLPSGEDPEGPTE